METLVPEIADRIERRRRELRPLVEEAAQLERALVVLRGGPEPGASRARARVTLTSGGRPRAKRGALRAAIYRELARGPVRARDIAARTGTVAATVATVLSQDRAKGLVEPVGDGRWGLTPAGVAEVPAP